MSFSYRIQESGGACARIFLHGEFDLRHASEVRDLLSGLIQGGRREIIVDLSSLDYIDSAGLGVLLSALTEVRRRRGELRIRAANPKIVRIFEVTKLSHLFSMDSESAGEAEADSATAVAS